jgi:hypothetical protein
VRAEVEATTWQTDQVTDRHRDPNVTVRPTEAEKTSAGELLAKKGWSIQGFLLACVRGLLHDPRRWIAMAEPYWRPDKPKGRPRKGTSVPEVESTSSGADGESADDLVSEPFEDPA